MRAAGAALLLKVASGLVLAGCLGAKVVSAPPAALGREGTAGAAAHKSATQEPAESGALHRRESCFPQTYEVCRNALDDNCNGVVDEGCGLASGVVQFLVAWDELEADVDLDVIDPSGELIEAGRLSAGGLFKEGDCPLREGPCPGGNLENVFLEGDRVPQRGVYHVRVRLEAGGAQAAGVGVRLSARMAQELLVYDILLSEQQPEISLSLTLH